MELPQATFLFLFLLILNTCTTFSNGDIGIVPRHLNGAKTDCTILTGKTIPDDVTATFHHIQKNYGHAPDGFPKEKRFYNREQILPMANDAGDDIIYTEYDVNKGSPRDAQRIVWGSGGNAYYTPDHYCTFWYMGNYSPPTSLATAMTKPANLLLIIACSVIGYITFKVYQLQPNDSGNVA